MAALKQVRSGVLDLRRLGTRQLRLTLGGWVAVTLGLILLCLVVPFWVGLPSSWPHEPGVLIALALTVVAGARLAILIGSGQPRFAELIFWTYVYLFAGLAPIAQMYGGRLFWPGAYDGSEWSTAMALTAIGVAAWYVGYRMASLGSPRKSERDFSHRRVVLLGCIGLVLTAAGVARLGLSAFFSSREAVSGALAGASGSAVAGQQLFRAAATVPAMAALFLLLWGRRRAGWALQGSSRFLLVTLAGAALVVANPISNPRFLFASMGIALFLAAVHLGTARSIRLVSVGLVAGVLFIFPIAAAFRYTSHSSKFSIGFNSQILRKGDYDSFQQTMNGLRYVKTDGHTLGHQLLGPLVFWVPRQIWAGKPEPTGVVIARSARYRFTNLGSPAWIEGYVDFGLVGTALVGLLLGLVAGRFDRSIMDGEAGLFAAIAPFYAGYQMILLRGTLMAVVDFLAAWVCVIWLCSKAAEKDRVQRSMVEGTDAE